MNNPYMVGKDDPTRAGGIIMEDWWDGEKKLGR